VKNLDKFPFAISLAASQIRDNPELRSNIRRLRLSDKLLDERLHHFMTRYPKNLTEAWNLAFKLLEQRSEEAAKLLERLSISSGTSEAVSINNQRILEIFGFMREGQVP
jgi:hypothetical protein